VGVNELPVSLGYIYAKTFRGELMRRDVGLALALLLWTRLSFGGEVTNLKSGIVVPEKAAEAGDEARHPFTPAIQTTQGAGVRHLQNQNVMAAGSSHDGPLSAAIRGTTSPIVASSAATTTSAREDTNVREKARSSRFKDAEGYEEALRLQPSSGKPIALYFYVDWCGYCARLEQGILSNQEVKRYLESILYVSINPDHGKAEEALFESFQGRGFPTFLILTKDRSAREISTSGSPSDFIQACKKAAQGGHQ
jgi:thiol-disulfide isomerase/thioredoxin